VKVYVVMVSDRHCDPEAFLFSTAETAVDYARSVAAARGEPERIHEQPIDGWLFHATYSVEGDSVWVVEKQLDATP
jgi:hypothetical protein